MANNRTSALLWLISTCLLVLGCCFADGLIGFMFTCSRVSWWIVWEVTMSQVRFLSGSTHAVCHLLGLMGYSCGVPSPGINGVLMRCATSWD